MAPVDRPEGRLTFRRAAQLRSLGGIARGTHFITNRPIRCNLVRLLDRANEVSRLSSSVPRSIVERKLHFPREDSLTAIGPRGTALMLTVPGFLITATALPPATPS
jgi:hypothetical protein